MTNPIDEFLDHYRREFDFYEQAARLVAQFVEARLQAAGVRSIVTSRAKSSASLQPKVVERAKSKQYKTVEDIYVDIADLAGVRVALYFPAQRKQVGAALEELFLVLETKEFPDVSKPNSYVKRFSGYSATHFRVQLRESTLTDSQKRYATARVEIQVASVLMHAWAEVEHDLVYKPHQGTLSEDEYAILDELNGLVMAGEIALERLQRAGDSRVAVRDRRFGNHFELAAYLLGELRNFAAFAALQAGLGRVDILFEFLRELNLATPEALKRHLSALDTNLERRPIVDQVVDRILLEDSTRYKVYEKLRAQHPSLELARDVPEPLRPEMHQAIGEFMTAWIDFETMIRQTAPAAPGTQRLAIPTVRVLDSVADLDAETKAQFERLRRMRNNLVHGIEKPFPADLLEAARQLRVIRDRVRAAIRPPAQQHVAAEGPGGYAPGDRS